ncbi:MAG: hypothetical protein HY077_10055 [Elusimicrobia bacterium]|nr:hypothetical protein [Elusimicrobiota bacterium]
MMKFIMSAFLLCPLRGGYCAPAENSPVKSRTLKEVTELALSQGEDYNVGVVGQSIGLGDANPTKEIYYDQGISPDGFEHVYNVLVKGSKPQGIVWSLTKKTKNGEKEFLEGFEYYLSLDGKLRAASTSRGFRGEVKFTRAALDSKTKDRFRKEMEFWIKDSIGLKWEK